MYIYWCCRRSVHIICCPYFSIFFVTWTSLCLQHLVCRIKENSAGTKKNLHSYYFVPSDLISTIQQKLRIVGNFMGVSLLRACSVCASLSFLRGWHPAPLINIITQAGCHPHHLRCYCHVRQDSLNSYDHWWSQGVAWLLSAFKNHLHNWLLLSDDLDVKCPW